jgi:hypothetical protein
MAMLMKKHDVTYDAVPGLPPGPLPEPTLGALATRFVRTALPRRLYQVLHLALPVAIDCAVRGWWRAAGWSLALAAFGAWGLADRWLADAAANQPSHARLIRVVRLVAGTLAVVPPLALLLEAFLRLLGNAPIS